MILLRYLGGEGAGGAREAERRESRRLLEAGLLRAKGVRLAGAGLPHNRWGKPSLGNRPDVHFSLSHCSGLAACAVAGAPVGIDVERVRRFSPQAARRACTGRELRAVETAAEPDRSFFRLWTLKESCLKAMGLGLSHPMRELAFHMMGEKAICLSQPEWEFMLWEDGKGFVMAACILAGNASELPPLEVIDG